MLWMHQGKAFGIICTQAGKGRRQLEATMPKQQAQGLCSGADCWSAKPAQEFVVTQLT